MKKERTNERKENDCMSVQRDQTLLLTRKNASLNGRVKRSEKKEENAKMLSRLSFYRGKSERKIKKIHSFITFILFVIFVRTDRLLFHEHFALFVEFSQQGIALHWVRQTRWWIIMPMKCRWVKEIQRWLPIILQENRGSSSLLDRDWWTYLFIGIIDDTGIVGMMIDCSLFILMTRDQWHSIAGRIGWPVQPVPENSANLARRDP